MAIAFARSRDTASAGMRLNDSADQWGQSIVGSFAVNTANHVYAFPGVLYQVSIGDRSPLCARFVSVTLSSSVGLGRLWSINVDCVPASLGIFDSRASGSIFLPLSNTILGAMGLSPLMRTLKPFSAASLQSLQRK
jgi:hypothetical protein